MDKKETAMILRELGWLKAVQLEHQYPNDHELGKELRKLVKKWEEKVRKESN